MEHRRLGRSGLLVSEISYGNWVTHGSQVGDDAATACVEAALDAGITTFDTADVYAGTEAESVLGRALRGKRREGLEVFTKVYWPTGPGRNDRGLSRKHIMESCHASLRRLQTDYVDLYQAHRYDVETPLDETLRAFDDLVRQGKVLYVGVSEWTADQIREAHRLAAELGFDRLVSNQPQYSMLWRVIEDKVVPAGNFIRAMLSDTLLERVQGLRPIAADHGLSMAQLALAWVLANDNVASAIIGATRPEQVADNVQASGVRLEPDALAAIDAVLGDVVVRDPAKTAEMSPRQRPA